MNARSISTPWGESDRDGVNVLTPEILFVSTPSHGGYRVTGESQRAIAAKFPAVLSPAGSKYCSKTRELGWYEEDCEWVIVALTFPELFPAHALQQARDYGTRFAPYLLEVTR